MSTETVAPLDVQEIKKLLPHRYPFLLVDRVVELVPGERIAAIKNVTSNEPFFRGHFPNYPVMPGVLIVEALAQAGREKVRRAHSSEMMARHYDRLYERVAGNGREPAGRG